MNPKSKLSIKYADNVIEMNTTFAKMMQNPLSDEYALLQKVKMENPGFRVQTRKINTNPKKDTYKGLTYEWMRNHIATHEPKNIVEQKLAEFDEMVYISKCHGKSLRYPTIKKWFLAQYPDVAKFGTDTADQKEVEETKRQNVVPFSATKKAEAVEVADAETEVVSEDIEKIG